MKFLCDQMLVRLGRWLRAAGYDTVIASQSAALSDCELLEQAKKEKRLLLTRDRHFCEMKDSQELIVWLKVNTLEECIIELSKKLPIDWLKDPFSRCLLCNSSLIDADAAILNKLLPQNIIVQHKHFWFCPHCQKVYWHGSHTYRMRQELWFYKIFLYNI